ncbi:MAG: TRAP transporter substrate-binding protein [Alphaproteobacteria bacterium]|nr:TRAP transporter substrate-binding protein [Alphaproteobacteria bacterium]
MNRATVVIAIIALPLVVAGLVTPAGVAARPAASPSEAVVFNRGVVELETASATSISVRIAEDLASIVNDGATRRLVPVIGTGSLGNLMDLKLLRGIDMAILPTDILDYAREQKRLPGIEAAVTYVTKLYNEEFHLLARSEIKSVTDLVNRKVNVDLRDSVTAIMAGRLFDRFKLPVVLTNDSSEAALAKLRNGEIAALAFVSGKPVPLFHDLRAEDGLHLLPLPFDAALAPAYLPTRLTSADYPGLVPQGASVETVAVGAVLVVANLQQATERDRNVANFVEAFFTGFQALLEPGHHAKWQEVNLAAELPGWRRYPVAEQWLQHNLQVAKTPNPQDLEELFARFVDERRQLTGGQPMTQREKNDIFEQYQRWQSGQTR